MFLTERAIFEVLILPLMGNYRRAVCVTSLSHMHKYINTQTPLFPLFAFIVMSRAVFLLGGGVYVTVTQLGAGRLLFLDQFSFRITGRDVYRL